MLLVFSGQKPRHGAKHPTMQTTVLPLPVNSPKVEKSQLRQKLSYNISSNNISYFSYILEPCTSGFISSLLTLSNVIGRIPINVSAVFEIVFSLGQHIISFFFLHIITATSLGENIKSHPITICMQLSVQNLWVTGRSTHQSYPDVALICLLPYKLNRQIIYLLNHTLHVWNLTQCFSNCLWGGTGFACLFVSFPPNPSWTNTLKFLI